jgi:hypothetical protein
MSTGATISITTIPSTVEATDVRFSWCCIWNLKEVRAQNHLSLWGDKSLSSRLRHLLRTLWDRVDDTSSR